MKLFRKNSFSTFKKLSCILGIDPRIQRRNIDPKLYTLVYKTLCPSILYSVLCCYVMKEDNEDLR